MARFCGIIGFASTEQTIPGVWSEKIIENQIPAAIERKYVQWDLSKTNTAVYYIKPFIDLVNHRNIHNHCYQFKYYNTNRR